MSNTLTFNNTTTLTPVIQNGVTYLTATDLAKALGYKSDRSVTNLYNANSDEFQGGMTLVIDSVTKGFGNGNSIKPVRHFTLRGCHLIAMFSRTAVAKEFRKWVLDILDQETNGHTTTKTETNYTKINHQQRHQLANAIRNCSSWVLSGGQTSTHVANRLRTHFNLQTTDDLPADKFAEAMSLCNELEKTSMEFTNLIADIKKQYLKEVIGNGNPWTPSLKRKWAKQINTALPNRPDWLKIEQTLEKKAGN